MKQLKIAILGTRGIPNNYGGFEQFAENLSVLLVNKGHQVTVYSTHFHKFAEKSYKGVELVKIKSPEDIYRGAANFIYDNRCVDDAIHKEFDVALVCGYATAVFAANKMKKSQKPVFVVNMDGLEWARSKWSFLAKQFIYWTEKKIIRSGLKYVSDHRLIKEYYQNTYNTNTEYIPYGADIPSSFNEDILSKYHLKTKAYFLVISRIEEDNNLEMIIQGYLKSGSDKELIIIGNCNTRFGKKLVKKYGKNQNLKFIGAIYDKNILDSLRYYSYLYFHGHSVGGTNPSLLEAMAAGALVIAHDNIYNRDVLQIDAFYFKSSSEILSIINKVETIEQSRNSFTSRNIEKIKTNFSWQEIADKYEKLFFRLLNTENDD